MPVDEQDLSGASKEALLAALLDTVKQEQQQLHDGGNAERLHRTKQLLQQELLRRAVVERQAREQVAVDLQTVEPVDSSASSNAELLPPQAPPDDVRDKGAAVRAAARAAFLAEQRDTRRAAAALKGEAPRQQRAPPGGLPTRGATTTLQRTTHAAAAGPMPRRAPAVSAPPAVAVPAGDGLRSDVAVAAPRPGRATEPPPRVGALDPVPVAAAAGAPDVSDAAPDVAGDVLDEPVFAAEDDAPALCEPEDGTIMGDDAGGDAGDDAAIGLVPSRASPHSSDGDIDSEEDGAPGGDTLPHPDGAALEHAEAWLSRESARLSQPHMHMLDGGGGDLPADEAGSPDEAGTADAPQEGDSGEEFMRDAEPPPLPDADDDSVAAPTPPGVDVPSPPRSAPAGARRPIAAAAGSRPARATTGTAVVSPPVRPRGARAAPRSRAASSGVDYTVLYPSFEHIFTGFAPVPGQGRPPRADPDEVASTCRSVADALDAWLAEHGSETGVGGGGGAAGVRYYRCPCATHEEVSSIVAKGLAQLEDDAGCWSLIPDADDRPSHTGPGSWNLLWTWSSAQRPPARVVPRMLVWQRWNHFAGIKALTRKDLLCRHLGAAKASFGAAFDIMPQTFALPGDYVAFVDAFTKAAAATAPGPRQQAAAQPLWIMKPIGLSRGRGIFMVRDLDDVAYGEPHVVQRYLERPLTVDGHKFDLRLYVLVTSFAPTEAFIYTEGFARFSTERYTAADVSNLRVHLTNYAVQSAGSGHSVVPGPLRGLHSGAAGGSKCSLTHLWAMLAAGRADAACDLAALSPAALWPRICDLVRRSLFSVRAGIGHQPNAFELLGFDVMLDRDARPWLLEVNSSPSLECDHPLDERIKTRLLADLLGIVGPPDYDRAALAEVLRRRGGGRGSDTREALNADLARVLRGRLPRRLGEPPPQAGLFQRIAPGPEWDALLKKAKQ